MAILYVGIDLAKNVFAVHGVNELGKLELVRAAVPRARLHELIAGLAPCTIGMKACTGAHHWARLFSPHGHSVRLIARLSGVGPTTATALLAMIGNGHEFRCGRQFAAWLGLTPGQYSSGGKTRLGRITKAGDAYLRSLLILGARATLNAAKNKTDSISRWADALAQRRGYWKAVVAIAAKNARMAWAMLAKGEEFRMPA